MKWDLHIEELLDLSTTFNKVIIYRTITDTLDAKKIIENAHFSPNWKLYILYHSGKAWNAKKKESYSKSNQLKKVIILRIINSLSFI